MKSKASILFKLFFVSALIFTKNIHAQDPLFVKISNLIDSVSISNLTNTITWLEEPAGHNSRVNFTPGNDSAAAYIYNEFKKMPGITSVELDTFYIESAEEPFNTRPLVNVIATFEGKTEPEKYYLLGAHLDASASNETNWDSLWQTIDAPGADDNATGVAAILEIARIISDPINNFENDYTLKFAAFGAEEAGPVYSGYHIGSTHYAQNAKANSHQILGMISIDLIGFNDNYNYQAIATDTSNQNFVSFAEKFFIANNQFGIDLIMEGPPFFYGTWSDHLSFWSEGYPAILMLEHAPPWDTSAFYQIKNPNLHTSNDTLGYLNMELVKKVTQLNLATFASLSASLNLTDVKQNEDLIADEFLLLQNYPNPFNPSTKMKFKVPTSPFNPSPYQGEGNRERFITLVVYDILGNKIAVLVNEIKTPGTYEVEFDGSKLTSGIYIYTLRSGSNFISRKMILLK
ncbi:MAG: M20/M25/M40 family metallo-hydrolase [Ignavibacteriae bacterium]|nr:M20/M25/M40 family metallo-hydrolase [Ignavibacteriota bacterium]NOG98132.1 M20/M25/M40 family metallo-hydrolase [Ignavibacteriota bacterium]